MRALPRTFVRSVLVTAVAGCLAAGPAAAALVARPAGHAGPVAGERSKDHPRSGARPAVPPAWAPPIGAGTGGQGRGWWPYGNVVHGAFTVETKEHGVVQLVAQRGTVTAVDDGALTVKSDDKTEITWATTASTRVIPLGPRHAPATLAIGAVVGVWGPGTPDAPTAAFVLVQRPAGTAAGGTGDGTGDGTGGGDGSGGQDGSATPPATAPTGDS